MKEFLIGLLVSGAVNAGISLYILKRLQADLKGVTIRHNKFVEKSDKQYKSSISVFIDTAQNEETRKQFTSLLRED
jgi:hypothetical protein